MYQHWTFLSWMVLSDSFSKSQQCSSILRDSMIRPYLEMKLAYFFRWLTTSLYLFVCMYVCMYVMLTVLTDNIIDQNHFENIIRTSLSNSRNNFGSIWNDWFCNEKISTKAIVHFCKYVYVMFDSLVVFGMYVCYNLQYFPLLWV